MAITVNGKDIKDAVIKTEQFEMKILELLPDHIKVSIKETAGQPFNFVPRFVTLVYPEATVNAKSLNSKSESESKHSSAWIFSTRGKNWPLSL
jgi:hypothetical protein